MIDTRLATLLIWGGGTVVVYAIVLAKRWRRWRRARYDRRWVIRVDARRDVVSSFALFLVALGSAASIGFVLFGDAGGGPRTLAIAIALGAFTGAGLVMASEEDDAETAREVDHGGEVLSPPHDPAGIH